MDSGRVLFTGFKTHLVCILIVSSVVLSCKRGNQVGSNLKPVVVYLARAGESAQHSWRMERADSVSVAPSTVSEIGYDDSSWRPAIVPGTVLNSLVHDGVYPEPYFGLNNKLSLHRIPDIHNVGRAFYTYWFRTKFDLPASYQGRQVWMQFDGINYIADIWVNGRHVGNMKGMFKRGFFNVSKEVKPGKSNVLAVKVEPVEHPGTVRAQKNAENIVTKENKNGGNGQIGKDVTMLMSVGWDFTFPDGIRDRDTGIWRDVKLYATGPVSLRYPFIKSKLPLPDLKPAKETVSVEVINSSDREQKGRLKGQIPGTNVEFDKEVKLRAGEHKTIEFSPDNFKQLIISNPHLWWPINKGDQYLYTLKLRFVLDNGLISDSDSTEFGIRSITSDQNTPDSSRIFYVNGKRIFIRGSNWIPEAMLRTSPKRIRAELRYTHQSGINMLRLWGGGIAESHEFFHECDSLGIMVWQEFWLTGDTDLPVDSALYRSNVRETVMRIRNHPSLAYYVSSNEKKEIIPIKSMLDSLDGTRGYQVESECCGVHDGSPYKYVNPMQYYDDSASRRGSRINGFCPEYGSPCMPTLYGLEQMMPRKDIWPPDPAIWKYLDGNGFHRMGTKYLDAVEEYGKPTSLQDFVRKGQLVGAVSYRSIWENWDYNKFGYGDRFTSGVLFWYHNSPIRQVAGRMWDWSLEPTAALYYTQNALQPLHAQLDFIKNTVSVYNDYNRAFSNYRVIAEVYSINKDGSLRLAVHDSARVNIPANGVVNDAFKIAWPGNLSSVHFTRLKLIDDSGKRISSTFYWSSSNHYKGPWTDTGPLFAGFKGLKKLPVVDLKTEASFTSGSMEDTLAITLHNPGKSLAFFVHLDLENGQTSVPVRPAFYDDNYISLLPGETRKIKIDFAPEDLHGRSYKVVMDGWNVKQTVVTNGEIKSRAGH